jgi:UTP--glucose-1-phosphate uridylyltransferase
MPHSQPDPVSKTQSTDDHAQAFENTSTNVAAAQMRNALTNLADTVKDPEQKKVSLNQQAVCLTYCSHSFIALRD